MDASVALAWGFPDEANEYADTVLSGLAQSTMLVPALFALEVTNALVVGERCKRIRPTEIRRFLALLAGIPMVQDIQPIGGSMSSVLSLAREHGLSAYDAAYLELAIRENAPLATLDQALSAAAQKTGVHSYPHRSLPV